MSSLPPQAMDAAAEMLRHAHRRGAALAELPRASRPTTLADGYAIAARVAAQSGLPMAGWKVAAILKDCPLAGRILCGQLVASGLGFPLAHNRIRQIEPEFAFRMARDLPPRAQPYAVDEVMDAVAALHPAIEIPNTRYTDFRRMDAPQLAADAAYSDWLVIAPASDVDWRALDLTTHPVAVWRNGACVTAERQNVLDSPMRSLTWIANALHAYGAHLRAGEVITTGGCTALVAVEAGDRARADFGALGQVEAVFD